MQLTQQNIQDLYKFTRKHFVEHYDVQTELVDHLANDIEQIWQEQPNLSFEEARDISFKKFGVFGFTDVIEEKRKQMHRKYWKIMLRFVKEWFQLPKILLTIIIFLAFFITLQFKYSDVILITVFLIAIIFDVTKMIIDKRKHKGKPKQKEKVFLLESMIGETRKGYTFLSFVNALNFINLLRTEIHNLAIYWIFLIATVATLLCIMFYITSYVIPQKAEELLEEQYPAYKKLNLL